MGSDVISNDRCCGEAGTFAISRPDIAKQVKLKKENEIKKDLKQITNTKHKKNVKILTTCPSCRQGLSRYEDSTGVESIYPIEVLAEQKLGKNWQQDFINNAQIETVLLL